jgi:D-tyrosyl-tRNA(Tyr) deacylase
MSVVVIESVDMPLSLPADSEMRWPESDATLTAGPSRRGLGDPGRGFGSLRLGGDLVRAVVQRVSQASVAVDGRVVGAIDEPGLLVLVGVTHDDTPDQAAKLAAKLWGLRILDGEKSCSDVGAPLLLISQFTLYADTRKGRRPSWLAAAPGPVAEPLVEAVVSSLRELGARVETGVFGASMKVSLVNDGPVTITIDM